MASISNIARRSICVAATRAPRVSVAPTMNFIRPALFSTNSTVSQVQQVEDMLKNMKYADLKDHVHEVRELMNEVKTNHSLRQVSPATEAKIAETMAAIQQLSASGSREEVNKRVCGLKRTLKQELYQ
jgi:hypothetical protein